MCMSMTSLRLRTKGELAGAGDEAEVAFVSSNSKVFI